MSEAADTHSEDGAFKEIDRHFADSMVRLSESRPGIDRDSLWCAAALVSSAVGRGDICTLLTDVAGTSIGGQEGITVLPDIDVWEATLKASTVVGAPFEFKPLILDGQHRLYLHRYWSYESGLAETIRAKAGRNIHDLDERLLKDGLHRLFGHNGSAGIDVLGQAPGYLSSEHSEREGEAGYQLAGGALPQEGEAGYPLAGVPGIELRNRPGRKMLTLYTGEAQGQLVGGCLSVFVSTLGTEWEVDTRDKILFFEDIDERPHRIDRYLTQLMLANKLQGARAILFGTFTRCEYARRRDHAEPHVSVLDIIRDRVLPLQKPCLYGLQFGHVRDKLTLPNAGYAFLDATHQRLLVEPAVRA
jgi:hypothetical protein